MRRGKHCTPPAHQPRLRLRYHSSVRLVGSPAGRTSPRSCSNAVPFIEDVAYLLFWLLAAVVAINAIIPLVGARAASQAAALFRHQGLGARGLAQPGARVRRRQARHRRHVAASGCDQNRRRGVTPYANCSSPHGRRILSPASRNCSSRFAWWTSGRSRHLAGAARRSWWRPPSGVIAAGAARTTAGGELVAPSQLFSVPRGIGVQRLGQLAPEFAQVFLIDATHDPSSDVRQIAITRMGDARFRRSSHR